MLLEVCEASGTIGVNDGMAPNKNNIPADMLLHKANGNKKFAAIRVVLFSIHCNLNNILLP